MNNGFIAAEKHQSQIPALRFRVPLGFHKRRPFRCTVAVPGTSCSMM